MWVVVEASLFDFASVALRQSFALRWVVMVVLLIPLLLLFGRGAGQGLSASLFVGVVLLLLCGGLLSSMILP